MEYQAAEFLAGLYGLPTTVPVPATASGKTNLPDPASLAAADLSDRRSSPGAIEAGREQLKGAIVELAGDLPLDSRELDGWLADTVEPGEPCPRCGALEPWQDADGRQRCGRCEAEKLARSFALADRAARLRRKYRQPRRTRNSRVRTGSED